MNNEQIQALDKLANKFGTLAVFPEEVHAGRGGAQDVAYIAVRHAEGTYSTHCAVLPDDADAFLVSGIYGFASFEDALSDIERRDCSYGRGAIYQVRMKTPAG